VSPGAVASSWLTLGGSKNVLIFKNESGFWHQIGSSWYSEDLKINQFKKTGIFKKI